MNADSIQLRVKKSFKSAAFRFVMGLLICFLAGWGVHRMLLVRHLNELRASTAQRLEFYRLSLEATLDRNESLPHLIALDERLATLLVQKGDSARQVADDFLNMVKERADIAAAYLMDDTGLTIASSNAGQPSSFVGEYFFERPYFKDAMKGERGRFYGIGRKTKVPGYFLAAPISKNQEMIGVVTVKVSLDSFESAWLKGGDIVLLADSSGVIFLTSNREWKYKTLRPLSKDEQDELDKSKQYGKEKLEHLGIELLQPSKDNKRDFVTAPFAAVTPPNQKEQQFLVQSNKVGHLGWKMIILTGTKQEREGALAGGIAAGFATAFLLSVVTYFRLNAKRFRERRQAEAALRQAHLELEQRITERTCDLVATNLSLEKKVETLKTTENILRETSDNAVQAGKLTVLGQMSAGISHEINQPLTALSTFADNAVNFLDRGRLDNVRENLGLIRQMADRMGHIVSEIKNFSRKTPAERRKTCLADVLNQTLMLVEMDRRRVDATIEVLPYPDDLMILAGPIRLGQVLVNLLRNALDAVAGLPERRVTVTVHRNGTEVAVTILDSGPGIAPEVLPRLFEPFFTTKPAGQGLGLGLPISRVIITELGGRLDVRSPEGCGAEFTITMEEA
jgi:two-component system C4-dicarboxylate transport sensor histidine kinase DctB